MEEGGYIFLPIQRKLPVFLTSLIFLLIFACFRVVFHIFFFFNFLTPG